MPDNFSILAKRHPKLSVSFKTVHGAKGLEADCVVMLGMCSGKYGFPVEISDDPLLDLVLSEPERHSNAEERRLLYVALTRARHQAYLLAEGGPPSSFITELAGGGCDVATFGSPPSESESCPQCKEGRILRRQSKAGRSIFFGCSNHPYCTFTSKPCPLCNTGFPAKSGGKFRCSRCGGSFEACPDCDGWLLKRMGKFGRFLGCSNYPDCGYTRNAGVSKKSGKSGRGK